MIENVNKSGHIKMCTFKSNCSSKIRQSAAPNHQRQQHSGNTDVGPTLTKCLIEGGTNNFNILVKSLRDQNAECNLLSA